MKARTRRLAALLAAAWLAAGTPAMAADSVGRLRALKGDVRIDAFGKGAFITALAGDLLYRETVVRLAADARATLEIGASTFEAPPGATLRVADLAGSAERRSGLKWTAALGKLVAGVRRAVRGGEEEVALGSRAAEKADPGLSVDWAVEEDEDETLYRDALAEIDAGDLTAAVEDLAAVQSESTDSYSAAELAFWRGYCYFQLGDYADAADRLEAARRALATEPLSLDGSLVPRLSLQLGASQFYLGRTAAAASSLRDVVKTKAADETTLYGYLFLVESLGALGDRTAALAELHAAEKLFPSGAAAAELAALKSKLSL